MAENEKIEIDAVRIADVAGDELSEAEQEKVTGGGGGYGPCPSCGGYTCFCNG
jgi:hypothetical protein